MARRRVIDPPNSLNNEWSFSRLFFTLSLLMGFIAIMFSFKTKKEDLQLSLTDTHSIEPESKISCATFDAEGYLQDGQVENYPVVSMSTAFVDGSNLSFPRKKLFTGKVKNGIPVHGEYRSFYPDAQETTMKVRNGRVVSIVAKNLKIAGGRYNGSIDSDAKPIEGVLIPGKDYRFFSPFYQKILYKNGDESAYLVKEYPYQNAAFEGTLKRDGDDIMLFNGTLYHREGMRVSLPGGLLVGREALFREGRLVTGKVVDFRYMGGLLNGYLKNSYPVSATIQSARLDPKDEDTYYHGTYDEEGHFKGFAEKNGMGRDVSIRLELIHATNDSDTPSYSR